MNYGILKENCFMVWSKA